MTKRDLVIRISNETGLIQQDVLTIIQKTLDYITEALAQGHNVELRNFGVFEVKVRKARVGRNPNRPETDVPIPARAVVKFKAGKEMKEIVLRLSPEVAAANAAAAAAIAAAQAASTPPPPVPVAAPAPAAPKPITPPAPPPTMAKPAVPAAKAPAPAAAKKKVPKV